MLCYIFISAGSRTRRDRGIGGQMRLLRLELEVKEISFTIYKQKQLQSTGRIQLYIPYVLGIAGQKA